MHDLTGFVRPKPLRRAGMREQFLLIITDTISSSKPDGVFKELQEVRDVGYRTYEIRPFAC